MTNEETQARPRRFTDQRGIALQTVIIMVVLLAIAGAIAAVLLTRGQQAASQLEATSVPYEVLSITNERLCQSAGGVYNGNGWQAKESEVGVDFSGDGGSLSSTSADVPAQGGSGSVAQCIPKTWETNATKK